MEAYGSLITIATVSQRNPTLNRGRLTVEPRVFGRVEELLDNDLGNDRSYGGFGDNRMSGETGSDRVRCSPRRAIIVFV